MMLAGLMAAGVLSLAVAEEMKQGGAAAPAQASAPAKKAPMKKKHMKKAAAAQEAKAEYVCEMCNVKSDKPGKCSKCGMDLKKKG